METNCLVTKLLGTVNNNNVPYLGELKLDLVYNAESSSNYVGIVATLGHPIDWECDADIYNTNDVNLGKKGRIEANVAAEYIQLKFTKDCKFKLYPMYYITYMALLSQGIGQCDLGKVYHTPTKVFLFDGGSASGAAFYGDISDKDFGVVLDNTDRVAGSSLPWLKGFNYDNLLFLETKITNNTKFNLGFLGQNTSNWKVPFLEEVIGENNDICNMLRNLTIAENIVIISLPFDGVRVGDFSKFALCSKLYSLTLHQTSYIGKGTSNTLTECIQNTLKNIPSLLSMTVIPPVGSDPIELSPVFDYWASLGRTANFSFWPQGYTVNGESTYAHRTTSGTTVIKFTNGTWDYYTPEQ